VGRSEGRLAAVYSPPPCGEGLGVGVEVDALNRTPLPNPLPTGEREPALPRARSQSKREPLSSPPAHHPPPPAARSRR